MWLHKRNVGRQLRRSELLTASAFSVHKELWKCTQLRVKASDPGCDEVIFFNKKETAPGTNTAVSSFVDLSFNGAEVTIQYLDEDFIEWGQETWIATKGRFGGTKFVEYDGVQK